jgi:hypothetical protein
MHPGGMQLAGAGQAVIEPQREQRQGLPLNKKRAITQSPRVSNTITRSPAPQTLAFRSALPSAAQAGQWRREISTLPTATLEHSRHDHRHQGSHAVTNRPRCGDLKGA